MARALLLVMALATTAAAQPQRVLVIDSDAELVHAIQTSLAPWKLVVVAEPSTVVDATVLAARAQDANAQFIVWREGGELVVYDRERDAVERWPANPGPMDPVAAASAALTVKTMMRLPEAPPPEETAPVEPITGPVVVAPPPPARRWFRVHAGIGGRVAPDAGLRGALAGMVALTDEFRLGVGAELGMATTVDKSSFEGDASDQAGFVLASWTFPVAPVTLEPLVGIGALRSTLDGMEGSDARSESAVVPMLRVGMLAWWPVGAWAFGASAGVDIALGTHTYTKQTGNAEIYAVPRVAGLLSLVVAWSR